MASEWRTATVEEISEKVAMGPFGSSIKVETFVSEGVPVISGQHLRGTRVDDGPGFNFITDEHAQRLSNANVQRGDIVFTHAGNIGQAAYIPDDSEFVRYVISQRQFYMRCDRSKAVPEFVTLYFRSPQGHHQLLANASQVGVPSIAQPVTYLRTIEIPLPPLSEQRAIAHILGTLDDKIELNRRMNETLEAMARGLFKSWFVDFDPVRAKAALRNHAALEETSVKQGRSPEEITPPLRGSRGDKGASPQASRWGESGATQPPRPWPDIKRQYTSTTLHRAQTLRQDQTNAEGLLWHYLRGKQLGGYKFRRQQPIGPYIADFACLPEKLLIELDGGQHADPNAPDEQRDRFLRQQGYRVLRFWNHEVFAGCFGVLESIYAALTHHPPLEGGSKDASLSGRGSPPPPQPAPDGLASATPPQGGSDWSVDRARAYLDAMDPEIAALFPDRFVDSELGEIPAGWEVKALPELIEVNPKRSLQQGELAPYLDMANMPTKGHVPGTVIQRPFSSGMRFANGDTLVARITPCLENGKTAYVDFLRDGEIGWGSTEYIVMRPKSPLPSEFAYCLARSVEFRDFAIQNMTGTSGRQRVPAKALSQFMFLLAPDQTAESFGRAVQPLLRRASRAVNNSRALAAFRDTLLPKLISGELRLRGWEGGQSCGPEC